MDCFLVNVVVLFGAGVSAAAFRKMEHGFGPYNLRAAMLPLVTTLAVLLGLTGTASKEAVMGLLGAIVGYLFGLQEKRPKRAGGSNRSDKTEPYRQGVFRSLGTLLPAIDLNASASRA